MGISMPTFKSRPITLIYDIPTSKTLRFWDGLKQGKIYATRCKKCGKAYDGATGTNITKRVSIFIVIVIIIQIIAIILRFFL